MSFVFNGNGGGVGQSVGWVDYNDAATAITPLTMTLADTWYTITNDGLGPNSDNTHMVSGHTDPWNTSTNLLDFSSLKYGDTMDYRLDFLFTPNAVNSEVEIGLELGVGGTSYILPAFHGSYKTTTEKPIGRSSWFYMDVANTLNNSGRFVIRTDKAGSTLINNGWALRTNVI